jgi:CheY-like chemotaxis protein
MDFVGRFQPGPSPRTPLAGRSSRQDLDRSVANGATPLARILVVEDQDDVRRLLVTALEIEGHQVHEARSAAEGLKHLQQQKYDLVLSDYAMPGGSGTWMLKEASAQGLLDGTVSIIVTAHPEVRDLAGVPVIPKPLDLDSFLEQVRRLLGPAAARGQSPMPIVERQGIRRVELVLYISSASPVSIQACRNAERLLERFDASQVHFRICDLVREPLAGEEDRITFTPTLVKRFPEPRMWVLGNLREPEILSDLLRVCGVESRE